MILVGIDVSKDKHDCFIVNSNGEILFDSFTILNNMEGFDDLFEKITSCSKDFSKIKVGLEATGHYSYNLLGYLLNKGLPTFVINPLHTNLFRKSLSLRQTKTDKIDSHTIATMLMSNVNLKSYSIELYHNEELKSLSRYRFDKVKERAKLKVSVSRLVTIHLSSIYELLYQFPVAIQVANANLTKLSNLLANNSHGRLDKSKAIEIKHLAKNSIGSNMPAKSLELKHTIKLIRELDSEISEIESEIEKIMDEIDSPILSIPGIGTSMAAMIISEIGSFDNFDSLDKILAFAGLAPTTYQSGKLESSHSRMEKRGSRYLRYALFNATKFVCNWGPSFAIYLAKKRAEGKHYNVAISHATKKLVRVMFALEKSKTVYDKAAA